MKAITYPKYGSPDVIQLKDIPAPKTTDDDILIEVHAASINALDRHCLRGTPWIMRLWSGLFKPKNHQLGADLSGIVKTIGKDVKHFQPGDKVFGSMSDDKIGSLAEYVCAKESSIVIKPKNLSFEEAGSIWVAATTALQGIRDTGKIIEITNNKQKPKVLINGASGGVGTFAIQIAKYFWAHVTAVCSTRNLETAKSLGADQVIDYTKENFTQNGQLYDRIFEIAAVHPVTNLKKSLAPQWLCVVIGFSNLLRLLEHAIMGSIKTMFSDKKIVVMPVAKMNSKDLNFLKTLLEKGEIKPHIEKTYPLNKTADAIRHMEEKHSKGKIAITITE